MQFFPGILILYILGAVVMRLTSEQDVWTGLQLLYLNGGALTLAGIVAGYVFVNGSKSFPRAVRSSAIATVLIVASLGYNQRTEIVAKLSDAVADTVLMAAVASPLGVADVPRHWDGHFRAAAEINGRSIDMLVDTGASLVLLTYRDALLAGVDAGSLDFDVPILTANGRSHVASLTLDQVNIGGVSVKNVKAAVAQRDQLHASLLGMSFLGEIEEAVIRKDRLILKN